MKYSRGPVLALLAALAAVIAPAQEFRGRVQGSVSDPSQAMIPGATVTLANKATGVQTVRVTSDTGQYLFDLVQPGTYTVSAEFAGFQKVLQDNVTVQSRGDVTVDFVLKPGAVQDAITVTEVPAQVQFNTSRVDLTLNTQLSTQLPNYGRNPFTLALLDPSVMKTRDEFEPYHSWGSNAIRIGGSQQFSNDLQVDGSPIAIGLKSSYVPPPDAVQEVNIQQNAVDAEYGHSSGGNVSIALKSGGNEWHGMGFYLGQYPWANALENRVQRTVNLNRNHMFGGTLGNAIVRNKLFNFFSYEQWRKSEPSLIMMTLPTERERRGDFSQSRNIMGGMRTIYDPFSTQTDPVTGAVTRSPYPNNIIPADKLDPVAMRIMQDIWLPNRAGDDITGLNNFVSAAPILTKYRNLSDRVDYNATDNLRLYGRISFFRTPVTVDAPIESPAFLHGAGSQRDASSYAADIVYTLSPSTVLNVHGDWHMLVDDAAFPGAMDQNGWSEFWTNPWYGSLFPEGVPVYYPRVDIKGKASFGQPGGFWWQHPEGNSFNAKVSQQRGGHYLKVGFDTRANYAKSYLLATSGFGFSAATTADTYINPDTRLSGDPYATFLSGALTDEGWPWSNDTIMSTAVLKQPQSRFYSGFFNDDWKVTPNVTLTLGLRYEYETPFVDPEDRFSKGLDTTAAIPEMNNIAIPEAARKYYQGPYSFTGAWSFTEDGDRYMWNPNGVWLPRVGVAWRLTDKMAIRGAWARYAHPWIQQGYGNTGSFLDVMYPGFETYQKVAPVLQGVPQSRLRDPFPASNPLIPPVGKAYGRYTGLGDSLSWAYQDRKRAMNDRFNVSVQRQLPFSTVAEFIYLFALGTDMPWTQNINMVDPRLSYQFKNELSQTVANPFYNFGSTSTFPGPLRYQQQVGITQFLRPFPQYGDLNVEQTPGAGMRFHSIQARLQKNYSNGLTMLFAYGYQYQRDREFFNDIATYLQDWMWQDSADPRHRISGAGVWELPFGRGRMALNSMPRVLDAILGGWNLSGTLTWRSGRFLRFDTLQVNGDPVLDNPTGSLWFNTAAFSRQPDFTARTNPKQYPGLTGPGYMRVDTTVMKNFTIVEGKLVELRMNVFNAPNSFTQSDPDTNFFSNQFGQALYQAGNTYGRRVELGMKFIF